MDDLSVECDSNRQSIAQLLAQAPPVSCEEANEQTEWFMRVSGQATEGTAPRMARECMQPESQAPYRGQKLTTPLMWRICESTWALILISQSIESPQITMIIAIFLILGS